VDTPTVAGLVVAAVAAGWVDAVVGGGGLLLLPALLVAAPGLPVATVLGTNKATAIAGTATAAWRYSRSTRLDWAVAGPSAGLAVLASGAGAAVAGWVPPSAYRPVVLGVLVAVALFVTVRPAVGLTPHPHRRTPARVAVTVAVAGGVIAAYDGLIGPGTGTFLVLTFTALLGSDFLHGSAMAKVVNAGTNLGALVVFGLGGHVLWWLAALLAVGNVAGALLGAHAAVRRGAGFVRAVLLVVVLALIGKLAFDLWWG
jgi:hypothetical protein